MHFTTDWIDGSRMCVIFLISYMPAPVMYKMGAGNRETGEERYAGN